VLDENKAFTEIDLTNEKNFTAKARRSRRNAVGLDLIQKTFSFLMSFAFFVYGRVMATAGYALRG
jgi:hypothetical protein